jgi:hypothetical protein
MGDEEEGVAEQPSEAVVVERARQAHRCERKPAGLPAKAEQGPRASFALVCRGGHAFVTGGLKIFDS